MLFALSKKENAIVVLYALIKKLNVRVSMETIKSALHEHPDYPSLLALSDCLAEWKIPNNAYQIDKSDYNPADLSFPLIAHLQKTGNFILINSIQEEVRLIYVPMSVAQLILTHWI